MKKLLAFLTAMLLLSVFAACGTTGGEDSKSSTESGPSGSVEFTIAGRTVELSYETNHRNLFYRENVTDMRRDTVGSVRYISDNFGGDPVFEIQLVCFAGKSVDEVMEGTDAELSDKTVNGTTYKYFEFDKNGVPGHTYVYTYENDTYTISFESSYDMTSLESAFMGTVRFAPEPVY